MRRCVALVLLAAMLWGCPADEDDANNSASNGATTPPTMTTPDTMPPTTMPATPTEDQGGATCVTTTVYTDGDGDGQGVEAQKQEACLLPGEAAGEGLAREFGDCDDADPLKFPDALGICGDNVDDNCDDSDEACPTTMPDAAATPNWDCTGTPPENVWGWARFADGGGNIFEPDSCFVFYEGNAGVFYVQRMGFAPATPCNNPNGCICPVQGGPSYDQRLYAFTLAGEVSACDEIVIAQAGPGQPVSNGCRKYLYQLFNNPNDFSFLSTSRDEFEARMTGFPTVEVACVRDTTLSSTAFPFASLASAQIERNDGFKPKR